METLIFLIFATPGHDRCPVLPFDYAGRGLADNEYVEGAYDEDGYALDI